MRRKQGNELYWEFDRGLPPALERLCLDDVDIYGLLPETTSGADLIMNLRIREFINNSAARGVPFKLDLYAMPSLRRGIYNEESYRIPARRQIRHFAKVLLGERLEPLTITGPAFKIRNSSADQPTSPMQMAAARLRIITTKSSSDKRDWYNIPLVYGRKIPRPIVRCDSGSPEEFLSFPYFVDDGTWMKDGDESEDEQMTYSFAN
ncbi:hypothetical protein ABW20_dc0101801 [Dactylellina cionopaga]|nr:hypothetical protein ABW20_dc0101801 [Dactylellina cionopaga]